MKVSEWQFSVTMLLGRFVTCGMCDSAVDYQAVHQNDVTSLHVKPEVPAK